MKAQTRSGETHPTYPWIRATGVSGYIDSYICDHCGEVLKMGCLCPADGDEFFLPRDRFIQQHSKCKAPRK
jgi:hypothetical protein